jgi:hypothetical protein
MIPVNAMKRILMLIFIILTGLNLYLLTTYVRLNDIFFISDIARDMYLLDEIREKALILIGPRSSVPGLFHGPLWAYLTYPGFILGNGNPVAVGWYWIFLIILFLISNFFITRKLFGLAAAYAYTLVVSTYFIFHAHELFNPYGALFFIPLFYYLFIRYIETGRVKFLIWHFFVAGLLIQFQMAVGAPFAILSFIAAFFLALRSKKPLHLLSFGIILIPLSTFVLFDLRHDFLLTKNVLRHLSSSDHASFLSVFIDRLRNISGGVEFIIGRDFRYQMFFTGFTVIFSLIQIKNKVNRTAYLVFLYFFIGFFILSMINRYNLLTFYIFPIYSLVFLAFSSFASSRYRYIFLIFFLVFYSLNLGKAFEFTANAPAEAAGSKFHWKSLYETAKTVFRGNETTLGYFVYAPDIMGYGPRYALDYARKFTPKKVLPFSKQPVTYLILEPDYKGNIYTSGSIFRLYQIHIYKKPLESKTFKNGYTVEKYQLTDAEMALPFDPGINPGLHYR